jgi:flagellum-specific peptidoglycan hydrolase FlgJ
MAIHSISAGGVTDLLSDAQWKIYQSGVPYSIAKHRFLNSDEIAASNVLARSAGIPAGAQFGAGLDTLADAPANVATPPANPPKAAAEASTPNINTAAAAAVPKATVPATTVSASGGTAGFFNSIQGLINTAAQPNCLNAYYQTAYHFRLFYSGDIVSASGPTGAQVTVAESGVTGYNIKSVQFQTKDAGNEITRAEIMNKGVITITEPSGASFLDAIVDAANSQGILCYTDAPIYLELTFKAYDETGAFAANPAASFSNDGRWTWSLILNTVNVKLNEAGAIYTIDFIYHNFAPTIDTNGTDCTPQSSFAVGDTVGDIINDYLAKLNTAWNKQYRGSIIHFNPISTQPVSVFYPNPPAASSKDPATFKMKPQQAEKNSNRNWQFDSVTGKYTVNVTPGYTIPEFILDAIKHTEEGQALAKGNSAVGTCDLNSLVRESITWVVEPIIEVANFDTTTGTYQKNVTFHISPNYSQIVTLNRKQVDVAKSTDAQTTMVTNLIANGLFNKQYDYIFTGLNTEIIDLDIGMDLSFKVLVSNYGGAFTRHDAIATPPRLNPIASDPNTDLLDVLEAINLQKLTAQATTAATTATPAATPVPSVLRVAGGNSPTTEVAQPAANSYIEDVIDQINDQQFTTPIKLWQGFRSVENEAGSANTTGQVQPGQSQLGAVFSQIYGHQIAGIDGKGGYQTIEMTIRGDPYWLGQSNVDRQIRLFSGSQLNVKNSKLPDHNTGNQHVYIFFRYPVQTGADFKPVFQSSTVFNGVYQVNGVEHHFVDGAYKQVLTLSRHLLLDPVFWNGSTTTSSTSPSATAGTGGAPSNSAQVGTSGAVPASGGTAVGASPQPGVDYTPGDKASFVTAFTPLAQQQSAATGVAPEVILAQAGLETGWGQSAPQNNFFGIKGSGASLPTTEVTNGVSQTVNQNFASNASPAASFQAYGNLMNTPNYSGVTSAVGIPAQAQALQSAGYATDPQYGNKITTIAQSINLPKTVASTP